MTSKEVLQAARKLLEEKGWCQEAFAKDEHGQSVPETDENAVCFCLLGAVYRAGSDLRDGSLEAFEAGKSARRCLSDIVAKKGFASVPTWNDQEGRTKEEALALLDEAAEAC